MAHRIDPPRRTQGDGMEKTDTVPLATTTKQNITMNLIQLPIKGLTKQKKDPVLANLKPKEPKFVPYEPYKAAVKPIIPKKPNKNKPKRKISLKELVTVHSEVSDNKIEIPVCEAKEIEEVELCGCKNMTEYVTKLKSQINSLTEENKTMKDENTQLENQLKFQVQVNGELKNLLVAAMGEDMETRVHVLTEDKLHLAKALLSSAETLSTHQEQTEWLASQCEVWRSKFLASSVMVEELARWKAGLTQKLNEAQDVLKKLLDEHKTIRDCSVKTFNNLSFLKENFDLISRKNDNKQRNVVDISVLNSKLSAVLVLQLLGCEFKCNVDVNDNCELTSSEKMAQMLISNPHSLHLIGDPDVACNAVVGAAFALSGQLYLKNHPPSISCCSHCSGEVKLI